MDLSIHNNNKDNNNHIRVVDLSLSKPVSDEKAEDVKTEDKLKSLLPQLDITALSILTLARLQVAKLIRNYLDPHLPMNFFLMNCTP